MIKKKFSLINKIGKYGGKNERFRTLFVMSQVFFIYMILYLVMMGQAGTW